MDTLKWLGIGAIVAGVASIGSETQNARLRKPVLAKEKDCAQTMIEYFRSQGATIKKSRRKAGTDFDTAVEKAYGGGAGTDFENWERLKITDIPFISEKKEGTAFMENERIIHIPGKVEMQLDYDKTDGNRILVREVKMKPVKSHEPCWCGATCLESETMGKRKKTLDRMNFSKLMKEAGCWSGQWWPLKFGMYLQYADTWNKGAKLHSGVRSFSGKDYWDGALGYAVYYDAESDGSENETYWGQ